MMLLPLAAFTSEDLIRWGIVFFVFVLPALKGIVESRKRAAEEAKTPRRPRPPPVADDDDPWGRLLRGETVAPPRAPPPVVPPAPVRPLEGSLGRPLERSLERPVERSLERSLETAPPAERSLESAPFPERSLERSPPLERSFESAPSLARSIEGAPPLQRSFEREGEPLGDPLFAEAFEQESLATDLASLGDLSVIEGTGLASAFSAPFGAFAARGAVDELPELAPELASIDWRSAVIHSEILAPPLALRGDGGAVPFP